MKGKITYREIVIILIALVFVYLWASKGSNDSFKSQDNNLIEREDSLLRVIGIKDDSLLLAKAQRDANEAKYDSISNLRSQTKNYSDELDNRRNNLPLKFDTIGRDERYRHLARQLSTFKSK